MPESNRTSDRCLAPKRRGEACERYGLPGAPFPLCLEHAAEVLQFLNGATESHADAAIVAVRAIEAEDTCEALDIVRPGRGLSVVYYMRIGKLIKIGYSTNLRQRLRFYPPDAELLAIEPGDRLLEGQRLAQFRDALHSRDEWFSPSVALLQHIKQLAANAARQDHGPSLGRTPGGRVMGQRARR